MFDGNRFDRELFVRGFYRIIWGFFLKLMIADRCAIFVNEVFSKPDFYRGVYVIVAGMLYSIELYTDFMACVYISKGVSNLFGIELGDNFRRPYMARSVSDFWRRWHISLSAWLKDYIYIPLGGNRKGSIRKYINIAITFIISGIWHGSGIKFIVWGFVHALYQIIGDITRKPRYNIYQKLNIRTDTYVFRLFQSCFTFICVALAWILFRADSLSEGVNIISGIFVYNPWVLVNDKLLSLGLDWKNWVILVISIIMLLRVSIMQEKGVSVAESIKTMPLPVRWGLSMGAILVIMVYGIYGSEFNPQDFIYGGF